MFTWHSKYYNAYNFNQSALLASSQHLLSHMELVLAHYYTAELLTTRRKRSATRLSAQSCPSWMSLSSGVVFITGMQTMWCKCVTQEVRDLPVPIPQKLNGM